MNNNSAQFSEESTNVYDRFHLYSLPDKFYIEPRDHSGNVISNTFLEIDRNFNTFHLRTKHEFAIPVSQADLQQIYGIIGVINFVSGPHLIVIKRIELVGVLNDSDIYRILETDIIPFQKSLYLNEKQLWYNNQFYEMIQSFLAGGGFYYSTTFDISYSLQWIGENDSPTFQQSSMIQRGNPRFVWNRQLCTNFNSSNGLGRYAVPIIYGFVGVRQCVLRGSVFKLIIISRRSIHRAGVRFHMRGTDSKGNSANFVETEQIVEFDRDHQQSKRCIASFIQIRGSIPLYWSQRPNLKWQPIPCLRPADDQLQAYRNHMLLQKQYYGGKHYIVNLVNQKGREKRVGSELERVSLQANLEFTKYIGFDFHNECKSLNWNRLSVLRDILLNDIIENGFFFTLVEGGIANCKYQKGFVRTNCMDCLDRTNVVQAMIGKIILRSQLIHMKIIDSTITDLDLIPDFLYIFKNLWADNGDECSKQYAGTGALKTDYTRIGRRTFRGAIQDGVNALTRYVKNNFSDGYKQDAIDLFLGNYRVDPNNLPTGFENSIINFNNTNGGAIIGATFSAAMTLLCILVSENVTATIFWMVVFAAFTFFIFLNGEEFVNKPKLKLD